MMTCLAPKFFGLLASFVAPFALRVLGWNIYFINAAWRFAFLIHAYFSLVETEGFTLEHVASKAGDELPVIAAG